MSGRRESLLKLASAMAFLAIVGLAVLIVLSRGGSGGDTKLEGVRDVERLLAGLPQRGLVLGEPRAKVTLLEYGDLQCPVCRGYSEEVLPQIVERQVRGGEAKISFGNFTVIGPESTPAGAAAIAAGHQGRGWSFVELFYRNQGEEDSGYVTDAFLKAIARGAGVPDLARWNRERRSRAILAEVAATTARAESLGFTGTPSFAVEGPRTEGQKALEAASSQGDLESAIAAAR